MNNLLDSDPWNNNASQMFNRRDNEFEQDDGELVYEKWYDNLNKEQQVEEDKKALHEVQIILNNPIVKLGRNELCAECLSKGIHIKFKKCKEHFYE